LDWKNDSSTDGGLVIEKGDDKVIGAWITVVLVPFTGYEMMKDFAVNTKYQLWSIGLSGTLGNGYEHKRRQLNLLT